ncbi:hypothetical protein DLAC_08012 [Tieghemostelium lacteum]|uniref:EF-hand domain-containing protein n=1 Tax=Tieghemostelium lacteum TaxID=361077 RepID=A0A151ZAZ9_TIELA|nr:hypothetical protein DLAC_08012 [Tieghemostelium lacteum]|eukprot:KYQ91106.1 hypothetical protein DLAC_08012 [Tieghemostelium lacteum]
MFNSFLQERQPNSDNVINAKLKLNEFFLSWLSKSETTSYINDLLSGLNTKPTTSNNTPTITGTTINNNTVPSISQNSTIIINTVSSPPPISISEPPIIAPIPPIPIFTTSNNSDNEATPIIIDNDSIDISRIDSLPNITEDQSSFNNESSTSNLSIIEPIKIDQNVDTETATSTTTKIEVEERKELKEKEEISFTDSPTTSSKNIEIKHISPTISPISSPVKKQQQPPNILSPPPPHNETFDDSVVIQLSDNVILPDNTLDPIPNKIKDQTTSSPIKNLSTIQTDTTTNINGITSNNNNNNKNRIIQIPQFYFPKIKQQTSTDQLSYILQKIKNRFDMVQSPDRVMKSYEEYEILLRDLVTFPKILNRLIYNNLARQLQQYPISLTEDLFTNYYKSLILDKEPEEVLFHILKKSEDSKYLCYEDFYLFSKTLIEYHSSLEFLKNTPEFQDRYQETIIIRIFYCISRNKAKITIDDLLKSNFIKSLSLLDAEPDINKHLEYFSYEHFYVIYCKFWELDTDHDLMIDCNDLLKYSNGSLTFRIVERIIENSIFIKETHQGETLRISYQDFVWFILSEEDKNSETSIEFWFKCIDMDCDGILSLFEMEFFYEEQKQRLDYLNLDPPVFKDLICQILDMVKPNSMDRITLGDLKKSRMAGYLFNVLFNITKFLQQESKESISFDQTPMADWHNFALHEYEKALAEETSSSYQDLQEEQDDFDQDDGNEFIRKRYLQNNMDEDSDSSSNNDDDLYDDMVHQDTSDSDE